MIIIYLLITAAIIYGLVAVASAVFGIYSRPKVAELISKEDLRDLRVRDRLSESALQNIAGNLTGNPVAEAQAALDARAATYSKELN